MTADKELNPEDPYGYRLAFVESFQKWGIHPAGMRSIIPEALLWPTLDEAADEAGVRLDRTDIEALFLRPQSGKDPEQRAALRGSQQELRLTGTRYDAWVGAERNAAILWGWLMRGAGRKLAPVIGLVLNKDKPQPTVVCSRTAGDVATEVHSVRTAVRRGPRGASVSDLVVEITQRRHGYFDAGEQKSKDRGGPLARDARHDFTYRAGCTLLIDPVTMEVRRVSARSARSTITHDLKNSASSSPKGANPSTLSPARRTPCATASRLRCCTGTRKIERWPNERRPQNARRLASPKGTKRLLQTRPRLGSRW